MSDEMIKDIDTTPDVQMQDVIRDSDDKTQRAKGKTFFRKKVCRFCANKAKIDYKDADGLRRFTTERGKILPRRITGTSLKFQRKVAQAVKKARHLALLPYVTDMMK